MTGRCWPLVASLPSDPARRYKHAFTEYGSWCSVSRQATEGSRAVFSRHTAAGRPARTVDGLLMLEEAKLDTHGEQEKRPPCGVRGRVPGRLGAQLRPNWPRLSWPPLRDRVRFEVWIGPQAPAEGRRGPWPARVRTTRVLVHRCSRGLRRLWEVGPIGRGPAGQLRPRTCWSSPVRAEGPEGGRRLRPCASFSQARCRPVKSAGKSTSRGATSPQVPTGTRTEVRPTTSNCAEQGLRRVGGQPEVSLDFPCFGGSGQRLSVWDVCPPSLHVRPARVWLHGTNSADGGRGRMEGIGPRLLCDGRKYRALRRTGWVS